MNSPKIQSVNEETKLINCIYTKKRTVITRVRRKLLIILCLTGYEAPVYSARRHDHDFARR